MTFEQLLDELNIDSKKTLERFGGMSSILEHSLLQLADDPTFLKLKELTETAVTPSEELALTVHTLKGLSANLGLNLLCDVCAEMLRYIKKNEREPLPQLLFQLENEYRLILSCIQEYKATL